MTRHDVIQLRQLADQTAISGDPTVPVSVETLHEMLDLWDDAQRMEDELEEVRSQVEGYQERVVEHEDAVLDLFAAGKDGTP